MTTDLKLSDGMTLSEKVAKELERTILKEMVPGDRLLPEPALALKFGVSRGTIRNSLKILEDAELISRHKKRGTIITSRAGLKTLTLIFPGSESMFLNAEYIAPVFAGMTEEAGRHGIDVLFRCTGARWNQSRPEDVERIPWDKCDGVIIYEEFKPAFFKSLAQFKNRVVVVDADATAHGLTSIVFNNREAGRTAARRLIEGGRKRLAFFGEVTDHGIGTDPSYLERFEGFTSEVLKYGVTLKGDAIFDVPRSELDNVSIERAADFIVGEGVDGVFDLTGTGSLRVRERLVARGTPVKFETVGVKTVTSKNPEALDRPFVTFDGFDMGVRSIQALRSLLVGDETPGMLKNVEPGFIQGGNGL